MNATQVFGANGNGGYFGKTFILKNIFWKIELDGFVFAATACQEDVGAPVWKEHDRREGDGQ